MAKRQCVFISLDTHENLVKHTQDKCPKVNIGSFVDVAIQEKIISEKLAEVSFSVEDIVKWKTAFDSINPNNY